MSIEQYFTVCLGYVARVISLFFDMPLSPLIGRDNVKLFKSKVCNTSPYIPSRKYEWFTFLGT